MSYLSLLTAFYNKSQHDNRLFPTHISLYVTLYQHWNLNKFNNPIGVVRDEIMRQSKIGSKATYHKCIRDLHEFQYLIYKPSFSPYQSSTVEMIRLTDTFKKSSRFKNEPLSSATSSKNEQAKNEAYIYNNSTNINKDIFIDVPVQSMNPSQKKATSKKNQTGRRNFSIPTIDQVKLYFEESNSSKEEANRFYNYYSSNGWLVGGKTPMKDWHAAARNWILNSPNFRGKNTKSTGPGNLHVNNDKNYAEPL